MIDPVVGCETDWKQLEQAIQRIDPESRNLVQRLLDCLHSGLPLNVSQLADECQTSPTIVSDRISQAMIVFRTAIRQTNLDDTEQRRVFERLMRLTSNAQWLSTDQVLAKLSALDAA